MQLIIQQLKVKKPSFLSSFEIGDVSNSILPNKWNQGESFVTKNISCLCGQKQFFLLTSQFKETVGLFKKKEVINHLAPVQTKCSECERTCFLFNPEIHGWSGEFNISAAQIGKDEPQLYSSASGEIFVNYSYQGEENYQDLIEDNISNLEDYFDTVSIYFKRAGSALLEEVVSYECR